MTTLTDTDREALWAAVVAKVTELAPTGSRSQGYYSADGRTCLTIAERHNTDGTRTVYQIEARNTYGTIDVTVDESERVSHTFWKPIADNPDRTQRVVVGDQCFSISPDSADPGGGDGHGGRLFVIEWLNAGGEPTGQVTRTRNLWHRGTVPPQYRHRLTANARFVNEGDPA